MYYLFSAAGSAPGIPGQFAGVRVDIANDGTYTTTPLTRHPHFEPADALAAVAQDESTTEAATPEHIEREE